MFKTFPIYLVLLLSNQLFAGTENSSGSVVLNWVHLSSATEDLPKPLGGREQTASLVLDIDNDNLNDFVIVNRSKAPSVVWFQRNAFGWTQFVVESDLLPIEAGGDFYDIDADGDLDIVFGGTSLSDKIWWWENPFPVYETGTPWARREIKNSGSNKHHDEIFGDFDNDGYVELVFWNQGARSLVIAEIPANPLIDAPWEMTSIYNWSGGSQHEGLAKGDVDGDGILDIVGGGRWFKHNDSTSFTPNLIDDEQSFSRAAVGQLIEGGRPEVVFVAGDHDGPLEMFEWDGTEWVGKDLLGFDVIHGHSLQIEDVDRDGFLDIFCAEMRQVTSNENAKMWILLGDGTGNFTKTEVATGFGNHESRLADLDSDGKIDILSKSYNWQTPRIDIWLQDNKISLNTWQRHVIDGSRPWRAMFITSEDIDGDTRKDIITGGWWYQNPGQITDAWNRNTIGDSLNNMAWVEDFNEDGFIDILGTAGVGSAHNADFYWGKNNGVGEFQIFSNIEPGEGDFLLGVMSGRFQETDNLQVALSWHSGSVGIQMLTLPSRPELETWTWNRIAEFSQKEALSAGDIDRDSDLDLLLGTEWLQNNTVIEPAWWDLNRNYRQPIRLYALDNDLPEGVVSVDINFTSVFADLSTAAGLDTNSIHMVEVDEYGSMINEQITFKFTKSESFNDSTNASGTLNLKVEGATPAKTNRTFIIYFAEKGVFDFYPSASMDSILNDSSIPNPDSVLSLVLCLPEKKTFKDIVPEWNQSTLFPTNDSPDRNKLIDMNGDGRLDAVVGYEAISLPGKLAWYEQPLLATETWTEHVIDTIIGPMSLDVADMDCDGDWDVVAGEHFVSNRPASALYVYENKDGAGLEWRQHLVYTGDEHHNGAQLVDIEGDGDLDILSIGWTQNDVLLYENTNSGGPVLENVTAPVITPVGGSFVGAVEVSISTTTQGAEIRYTLDGTTPNSASLLYEAPFVITKSSTIKAKAFKTGYLSSEEVSVTYLITSDGIATRATNGLQALYLFEEGEGTTVNDVSGIGNPLNLTIDNSSKAIWGDSNISISSSTIIKSSSPATKIIEACKTTNEISIDGWIKPANLTQNGPARIVTLSTDLQNRNFAIGQDRTGYDSRLRTTVTGNNGSSPSLEAQGIVSTSITHFAYTRNSSGTAKFYINGSEVASSSSIGGNLSNWSDNEILALGNEITNNRAWLGEIYLIAVYNRALTSEEALQNYYAGLGSVSALPVELVSFNANVTGNDVELTWRTASESNNYGFRIERSLDAGHETVGFVEAETSAVNARNYSFIDKDVPVGIYTYHLKQIDLDGTFECSAPLSVKVIAPKTFSVSQNYPNPFNPTTNIEFELPEPGQVNLQIYNVKGEFVKSLIDEKFPAGVHTHFWNANGLASGVYFYRLSYVVAATKIVHVQTRKLVFLQ